MAEMTGTRRRAGEPADIPSGTLVDLFHEGLARGPGEVGMLRRRPSGEWASFSRDEIATTVREIAGGLRDAGFERGDRVGILSSTRMEWALADYGIILAGLVSVPVYPSLTSGQILHVLSDSEVKGIFVEGEEELRKLSEIRGELPALEWVVLFDEVGSTTSTDRGIVSLDDLRARGRETRAGTEDAHRNDRGAREQDARETRPDDLATLIYTSGTTGTPKGVMLTHANLYTNVVVCSDLLPLSTEDRCLSWLPLAHVLERMAGHYLMWQSGPAIAYAESRDTVARDMVEVRPTIMISVPRLYQKFYEKAAEKAAAGGSLKEKIFSKAADVARDRGRRRLEGRRTGPWLKLRHRIFDRLVYRKLRARTGGRMRFMVSGGAPLQPAIGAFFWGADLPILEGYGLTETSPVLTVNPPDATRLGTAGPPVAGTELKIADDGEILCRGPQVMKGYYRNEEATREAFTGDGWFRTGDIGRIDPDGYLSITDRKKQILVTSYGKNIAPGPVEAAMESSPLIEHALLIGDGRKFPIALVQPEWSALAKALGRSSDEDPEALATNPGSDDRLETEVEGRVQDFARYEQPRAVLVVPDRFSVESGELTPTMKIRRRVVEERYAEAIDGEYAEAERAWEAEKAGDPGAAERETSSG